jgi:hypothetical protein
VMCLKGIFFPYKPCGCWIKSICLIGTCSWRKEELPKCWYSVYMYCDLQLWRKNVLLNYWVLWSYVLISWTAILSWSCLLMSHMLLSFIFSWHITDLVSCFHLHIGLCKCIGWWILVASCVAISSSFRLCPKVNNQLHPVLTT